MTTGFVRVRPPAHRCELPPPDHGAVVRCTVCNAYWEAHALNWRDRHWRRLGWFARLRRGIR